VYIPYYVVNFIFRASPYLSWIVTLLPVPFLKMGWLRRWMAFTILSLTFVAINFFTMVYWHSNVPLESNSKVSMHQNKKSTMSSRQANSIGSSMEEFSNATISTIRTLPPSTHKGHQRSERQDRMVTLDRLKNALEINSTVELLRTINTRGNGIPLWSNIEQLYGNKIPLVVGMDQCRIYQTAIPELQRWIAPAGLFHTGTNLLTSLMTSSCHGISFQGQVPYGKHNPIRSAQQANYRIPNGKFNYHMVQNFSQILPIVMVRHPLDWIKSMCQRKYAVSWNNTTATTTAEKLPCPSLDTSISVNFFQRMEYYHLMDMWIQWNEEYFDYFDTPRLMVRLEDLVYAPKETLQVICDCVGGNLRYQPQSMTQRKGGVEQEADGNNFLIKAWARHSHVSINHTLSSSAKNQQLFRTFVTTSQVQRLLEAFQYTIL
jgi:hypothetical protein